MSDCPHNENNPDYCVICLKAEIERLTAERDASRRMYVDACLKVAEMTQRIAELEAESIADKLRRKGYTKPEHSAYHDAVDGYCGKRSSKAGLQAGETEHE